MRFSLVIISAFLLATQVSAGKTEPKQLQIGNAPLSPLFGLNNVVSDWASQECPGDNDERAELNYCIPLLNLVTRETP